MAAFTTVLAFDLGASTGRAIRAVYDGERLQWKEIHRFDNIPAVENGHLRWNMEALLGEIRIAIQKAGKTDSLALIPGEWILDCWMRMENYWRILFITGTSGRRTGPSVSHRK